MRNEFDAYEPLGTSTLLSGLRQMAAEQPAFVYLGHRWAELANYSAAAEWLCVT